MWVNLLLMTFGFAALIWSADKFLSGAAATATNLGVSNIVIGLTVVSLGTSAPEIVVALIAALEGNAVLAIGHYRSLKRHCVQRQQLPPPQSQEPRYLRILTPNRAQCWKRLTF